MVSRLYHSAPALLRSTSRPGEALELIIIFLGHSRLDEGIDPTLQMVTSKLNVYGKEQTSGVHSGGKTLTRVGAHTPVHFANLAGWFHMDW